MVRFCAVLAAIALVWACGGDNPAGPPPPEPARPTTLTVSPATAELTAVGATAQLTAEVRDQNGRVMAGTTVTWSSSDMSVATVGASGLVTAAGEGMATITAIAGPASGSATVTVTQPVVSVEVSPSAETVGLGRTLQLTAVGFDESGDTVEGARFSWESSNVAVARVNASGLVTGVAEGTATISASAGSGLGTVEITVVDLERMALEALYEATDGPNWANSENWLTDAPLEEWYGVDTDASGRVVGLVLSGIWDSEAEQPVIHGLAGVIPPELGNLTSLTNLDLGYNLLSGPIPPELANLTDLGRLVLRRNFLTGPVPPEIGDLRRLESLDLFSNDLSGPIPPEIGRLTRLSWLVLSRNDLSGSVPPELGDLRNLTNLFLRDNSLSGPIPESLLEVNMLERFRFQNSADLCAPGTTGFVAWLERIERVSGPYCNESDMKVLDHLYQTSGGPDWTNSTGWLGNPALDQWHGVTADAVGRVRMLDLAGNGLEGRLPAGLGTLAEMTVLRVGGNALSGRLPLSLARHRVVELHYAGTALCVPADPSFRTWLDGLPSHEGTGMECDLPSDREVLVTLYEATEGPGWANAENWLTDAPLGEWYGVDTDAASRVVDLDLAVNRLAGPIPPELGNLASLRSLRLSRNDLAGPIPPELGNLAGLDRGLSLSENDLTGPIPPELGRLTSLTGLYLSDNDLTGPIPSELGNLSKLWALHLHSNRLAGPIPSDLGRLTSLGWLSLAGNDLTGPVPVELGSLTSMRGLDIAGNDLAGALPRELAGISTLRQLSLGNNSGLSGPLPAEFTELALETLVAGGTDLCAPSDPDFQAWLETVHQRRIVNCTAGPRSMAYLTQAVQSRDHPVPLVAGEQALLRVFVTAAHHATAGIPPVRARFYLDGTERHVAEIPSKAIPIPTQVFEHDLSASANAGIPGGVIQPGLEMVIEIDPEGTLDPDLGVARRIPESGRMAVEVREMPVFDLTVIPFLWSAEPNREVVDAALAMAEDPESHELLRDTRTLLPIARLEVTAHEPVMSSSNDNNVLLAETGAIRAVEGATGHYLGMMSESDPGGGIARQPGRAAFAEPHPRVIAHELGHNLSLRHAPCGNPAQRDLSFPHPDGSIGTWGYDFRDGGRLVPPAYRDLMSYCRPEWVSGYHFTNALRFRLFDEQRQLLANKAPVQEAESLLLWGGTDPDGQPYLNPAFVIDAPLALPGATGEHRIVGRTASGDELFTLEFAMPEVADGDGGSSFAFVLPVEPDWADSLAVIAFSGPGGSTALDGDTDIPMTILLDPGTGQVRGILRDLPPGAAAAALAPQANPDSLDVLFSRGIPDNDAWDR